MPPSRQPPRRSALGSSHSLTTRFIPRCISSFFSRFKSIDSDPKSSKMAGRSAPLQLSSSRSFRYREIGHPRSLRRSSFPRYQVAHPHFIHSLPFEILALIFVLGAEDDIQLPITVSHVCRQWRGVALRSPSLWRRVSLSPHERLWRERIDRARTCSLDVELLPWREVKDGGRRAQDLNAYTVQWYMYLVLPFVHRWRSLDLLFTDYQPYLWRGALAGCGSPAPALEELSLVYRLNDNTDEFLLFSAYAPRLRRLTIDGIRLSWSPHLFGNLAYLDYTHHGFTSGHQAVDDVISILTVSERLVDLRLLFPRGRLATLPSRTDYVTRRVRLRHLKHLRLTVDGSDIPFELAHLVTLVSVRRLSSLRLVDLGHSHNCFPSLKSFFFMFPLPRSLEIIDIGHGWYDPRMIQPLAQSLPRLSKIAIKKAWTPDQVLELCPQQNESGSLGKTHLNRINLHPIGVSNH